jgi:hypothetical protein
MPLMFSLQHLHMLRTCLWCFPRLLQKNEGSAGAARRREGESRGLHVVSASPTRVSSSVATRLCNSAFVPESVDHGRVPAVLLHDMCVGKTKTMFLRTWAAVLFFLHWHSCLARYSTSSSGDYSRQMDWGILLRELGARQTSGTVVSHKGDTQCIVLFLPPGKKFRWNVSGTSLWDGMVWSIFLFHTS